MGLANQDLRVLRDEIAQDPAKLGYAGLADAGVAGLLNAPIVPAAIQGDVPILKAAFALIQAGKWAAIQASTDPVIQPVVQLLLTAGPGPSGLMAAGNVRLLADRLISLGLLTASDKAAVLALGQAQPPGTTRARQLFSGYAAAIAAADVAAARVIL